MQEINFKDIKEWLENGEIASLAKKHGLSRTSAYKILSGKSKNFSFVEAALTKASENKARILGGQDRMKKLSI